ncbi:hypothetical protein R4P70_29955 [Rhodococcus sp. IEGM 1241]|uniref:hypothetical protein n=1 Tax=Rhodococcus sp. IEGM 1241 TaxID=3082228 RepID=UPI00295537DC|nr:hypothetical protein [Rhodococcus sp. IEGM 1241]MDV8015549.1 hypothetical protein [Rhodococcus sp. IEGM 1241]
MSETEASWNAWISVKLAWLREIALQNQSTEEFARSASLDIVEVHTDLDAPGPPTHSAPLVLT